MKWLLLIIISLAGIETEAAMPVEVVSTAEDSVGVRLVYAFKEKIRESNSLEITLDDTKMRLQASIVTLKADNDDSGNSTIYSIVLNWVNPDQPFPFFLTQYTGRCGSLAIESCASRLVAAVSEQSDQIIKILIKASKR